MIFTDEQVQAVAMGMWEYWTTSMTRTQDQWKVISEWERHKFIEMARAGLEKLA